MDTDTPTQDPRPDTVPAPTPSAEAQTPPSPKIPPIQPKVSPQTTRPGFTCAMPAAPAAPAAGRGASAGSPPSPPKRRGGCLLGFLGGCLTSVILLFALPALFILMLAWLAPGPATVQSAANAVVASGYAWLRGADAETGEKTLLRLELSGVIGMESGGLWGSAPDASDRVTEAIEGAIGDDVDAILLVIDSPGGSVTASDELYHALLRFREAKEGRRVYVQGRGIIASGAYYAALPADRIRLQPTTVIGSIGVIIPSVNLADLTAKLGIRDASVASGAYKDLGNPLRPENPAHTAVLKQVVDAMHTRFAGLVAQHRKLGQDEVAKIADGRIFDARDAVNRRLADEIGYEDTYDEAIAKDLGCEPDKLRVVQPLSYSLPRWQLYLMQAPERFGRALLAPLTESSPALPAYRY